VTTIYMPQGKAREYSPLALNLYSGCDHGCTYCYVEPMFKRFNKNYVHSDVSLRKNILNELEKGAKKWKNEKSQVLLSFTGDPYCHHNESIKATREALNILYKNKFPVAVLTKGGSRCLQDLDIFKKFGNNIKVGATLTFTSYNEIEKNASLPSDRLKTLEILHENGINTWASFEPVINSEQSLELIVSTLDYVDAYKIGKWNHSKEAKKIDWQSFVEKAVNILRSAKKEFYIKHDLRACTKIELLDKESDMDYLSIGGWNG